jgi:hypothetical protein
VPVFTVRLPEYQVDPEPDHGAIGKVVDDEIRRHFLGRTVVARALLVKDHPGKTVDDLVEIIKQHGTDRYDPDREGNGYENVQNRHIDLFAFRRKVTRRMRLFMGLSWGFYHAVEGQPGRIDLLILYDATKLKSVLHRYEGRTDSKRDGFVFRHPAHKHEALLGIVKIL